MQLLHKIFWCGGYRPCTEAIISNQTSLTIYVTLQHKRIVIKGTNIEGHMSLAKIHKVKLKNQNIQFTSGVSILLNKQDVRVLECYQKEIKKKMNS